MKHLNNAQSMAQITRKITVWCAPLALMLGSTTWVPHCLCLSWHVKTLHLWYLGSRSAVRLVCGAAHQHSTAPNCV